MGDDRVNLPEWLKLFALLVGGDLPMDDTRERLRVYGQSLQADFAPSVFTATSARHVARHANPKGFFPRYAEVAAALVAWAKANPIGPKSLPAPKPASFGSSKPKSEAQLEAEDRDWWAQRIAGWRSLPPYAELSHLHGAMLTLTGRQPAQGGKCHPRPAIVARVAARIAELEAKGHAPVDLRPVAGRGPGLRYKAHNEAHGPTVTTRPATSADPFAPVEPKPPVDPHAPGRPLTLPELNRKLFRLQREAASADPPPNAADRIARLQEHITALSGPGGSA
jgi:hypothetical protein